MTRSGHRRKLYRRPAGFASARIRRPHLVNVARTDKAAVVKGTQIFDIVNHMERAEILRAFERATGVFAQAAVEAAVARQEEIVPELLRIMDDAARRAEELDAEGDYMAHLYAMYLLAQFREVRAYPLLVRFASLPGDLLDSLCGDFITEDLGRVLASVCGGELEGIQSLIENEDTDEWVRSAALSSLVALVGAGQKTREEILSYFAELFRGKLVRQWSEVWCALVCSTSDLYPAELIGDIKQAYQDGLIDPVYIGFDDVERDLVEGKDQVLARLARSRHFCLVEDTVKEFGSWACFHEEAEAADAWTDGAYTGRRADSLQVDDPTVPAPYWRPNPKIGRNEPCPCGSGKKYKKCCGA